MNRNTPVRTSPFIKLILAVFIVLMLVYIPLKIYIASSGTEEAVADGTKIRIYVTNELNCYREPCG